MINHLPTLLVLHVLGIAVLLGKFKLITRPLWMLATGLYFLGFYLVLGLWLASDPTRIVPDVGLKNDFHPAPAQKLPTFFQDLPPVPRETDEDGEQVRVRDEDENPDYRDEDRYRERERETEGGQVKTAP